MRLITNVMGSMGKRPNASLVAHPGEKSLRPRVRRRLLVADPRRMANCHVETPQLSSAPISAGEPKRTSVGGDPGSARFLQHRDPPIRVIAPDAIKFGVNSRKAKMKNAGLNAGKIKMVWG